MDLDKIQECIDYINGNIENLKEEGYNVSSLGLYGGCLYVEKIYINKETK